ncbi:Hypothetical protein OINT_4000021 [Brucella intermedia LMG 3301]|uniref:Uncharacterized protein n=1 Tax=Brucella intermedia LMG 3301 TaxID=641118 RepID=C4WR21_9HYPH|nr:Hypothetical protein OINT_4000021 [Brucella intermedia LMG 3301]
MPVVSRRQRHKATGEWLPLSGNLLKKQAMDQNFITCWMQVSSDQYLRLKCRSKSSEFQRHKAKSNRRTE